jgi:lipoyl(octanoyl) transferase
MKVIRFRELGRLSYEEGLTAQKSAHAEVVANGKPILLSLEHDPVYTLGRRDMPNQFLSQNEMGIPVVKTDRGGEITYHGPGQAVVYILLPLTPFRLSLPDLVFRIEQAIIDVSAGFGVAAERKEGWRGVFVGPQKLASIGLSVHRDVTMHGLAYNVDNDLTPFSKINPCGLPIQMCSLATLERATASRGAVGWLLADALATGLGAVLDVKFVP